MSDEHQGSGGNPKIRAVAPAADLPDDFGSVLDRLVKAKEEKNGKHLEKEGEAGAECFRIIRELINPLIKKAEERYNRSSLSRKLICKSLYDGGIHLGIYKPKQGNDKQALEELPSGCALIFYCDVEEEMFKIDVGEFENLHKFTWEVGSGDGRMFRKRAGQVHWNYPAVTDEIIKEKILLFLEIFG